MPAIYRVPQKVRDWSHAHPHHIPIFILIETKQELVARPDATDADRAIYSSRFDALDAEIRSVFPPEELITPDDVRGSYETLNEAVLAGNWPTLKSARGKMMFLMDQRLVGPVYIEGIPRCAAACSSPTPCRASPMPHLPSATMGPRNDRKTRAQRLSVRTRTDADTTEARTNDTRRRDAMLASGAQIIARTIQRASPRAGMATTRKPARQCGRALQSGNAPAGCKVH